MALDRQAALGAEITVPTIDGNVKYNVPEGVQPGDIFKLKGKGIKRVNGSGRGDQYVKVTVEVPRGLTEKQKEAIRQLDGAFGESNYKKRRSFFDKFKDK